MEEQQTESIGVEQQQTESNNAAAADKHSSSFSLQHQRACVVSARSLRHRNCRNQEQKPVAFGHVAHRRHRQRDCLRQRDYPLRTDSHLLSAADSFAAARARDHRTRSAQDKLIEVNLPSILM